MVDAVNPTPSAKVEPGRQFRWWREGGFRLPALARLTHGRLGAGRWTRNEIAAIDARATAGTKALLWCAEHREPRCVHRALLSGRRGA